MPRRLEGEPPYPETLPWQFNAVHCTAPFPQQYSQLPDPAIPDTSSVQVTMAGWLQYGDKSGLPHSPPYEAQWTCSAGDPPLQHGQSERPGGGWCRQGVALACNINIVLIENSSDHIL